MRSMGLLLRLMNFKDDLIECKCLFRNKNFQQKCDEKLKERVLNTCEFSNHDSNNFILLFRKGVIYMNMHKIAKNSMKHHYLKKKTFIVI